MAACGAALGADETPAVPAPPAASLEAVVVTGDKLSVQTLVDRKVYSVSTDVQTTFGTLSDILGVIPPSTSTGTVWSRCAATPMS